MAIDSNKLKGSSTLPQDELLNRLKNDFPEIFSENKVDIDKLKAILKENTDLGERYGLSWKGKNNIFRAIQETTTNTLKPDQKESVDFDTSDNLFIEGDNLEVLKVLQRSYYGKVKMIYIDPPYNTGNDFVYHDKFAQSKKEYDFESGIRDEEGNIKQVSGLQKNTKDSGHYHSNWLNMMYPRLYLARNLLRQDGVIFVSIDDNEVQNLRLIMNEIFGEENFIVQLVWKSRISEDVRALTGVSNDHEYIISYGKSSESALRGTEKDLAKFSNPDNDARGDWRSADLTGLLPRSQRPNTHFDLIDPETNILYPSPPKGWRFEPKTMEKKIAEGRILFPNKPSGRPRHKLFIDEMKSKYKNISSVILNIGTAEGTREMTELFKGTFFPFPKPSTLIELLAEQSTDQEDVVLDLFAGSGTTAQAVMQLNKKDDGNRKWIMVQLAEKTDLNSEAYQSGYKSIADIARERIRLVGKKILGEHSDKKLDIGFKAFRLEQTNFKIWDANVKDAKKLEQQMLDMFDVVREDATEEDLLFELMLKSGIELTTKRQRKEADGKHYWKIGDDGLFICLAREMTESLFIAILAEKPKKLIFLDNSLQNNDQLKTNLLLQAEKEEVEVVVI